MRKMACDCDANNIEAVNQIKERLKSGVDITTVSNFFKVIGDETRLKIMMVLFEHTVCVNAFAVILDMSKSAISHQLKVLKDTGHVKSEKQGKNVYYSINDNHVVDILKQAIIHIEHK